MGGCEVKLIHLTDSRGTGVLINADQISTVEEMKAPSAYRSAVTMQNTQRFNVMENLSVITEWISRASSKNG